MKEEAHDLKKIKEEAYKELEAANEKIKNIKDQMNAVDEEINSYGGKNDNFFEKLKRIEN